MKSALLAFTLLSFACGEPGSGEYAFESRHLDVFTGVVNLGQANLHFAIEESAEGGEVTVKSTKQSGIFAIVSKLLSL